jgi:hypothetical protein
MEWSDENTVNNISMKTYAAARKSGKNHDDASKDSAAVREAGANGKVAAAEKKSDEIIAKLNKPS